MLIGFSPTKGWRLDLFKMYTRDLRVEIFAMHKVYECLLKHYLLQVDKARRLCRLDGAKNVGTGQCTAPKSHKWWCLTLCFSLKKYTRVTKSLVVWTQAHLSRSVIFVKTTFMTGKKKHLANWTLLYEIINPPPYSVLSPQYQAMSPVCMSSAGCGAERENNRAPTWTHVVPQMYCIYKVTTNSASALCCVFPPHPPPSLCL